MSGCKEPFDGAAEAAADDGRGKKPAGMQMNMFLGGGNTLQLKKIK